MQISLALPEKWSHYPLPPELIRTAAAACPYKEGMLIYGGSSGWIRDEEYALAPPHLLLYDPESNTIRESYTVQGDIMPSMNAAMFYDKTSDELYILAAEHNVKYDEGPVAWIIDMQALTARPWDVPREAQFFSAEAWGYDPDQRRFYTFHLAGSRDDPRQVFYRYDLSDREWNLLPIPPELQTRHSAGGVFIPEKRLFALHSGYFWDERGRPATIHDNWFYYPDRGEWKHIPCGEQIGSSSSALHYDAGADRIIILPGSPNGVSRAHTGWSYRFNRLPPRGHCSGEIQALFSLPITLPIRPLSFIFRDKLYIMGGSSDNINLDYGLILDLADNPGIDILG